MIPIGTIVTADAIIIYREVFVTKFAVTINTRITSPWFIWIFSVQFYVIVREI